MANHPSRVPQPRISEFRTGRNSGVYPTHNPISRGYAVRTPNVDPARREANGCFVNQLGQKIDFYIESIAADFQMAGSTAQSRTLRQFFPHNMVQPSIMVTGIAPNSYQYNRLAQFVRLSHHHALSGRAIRDLGVPFRNILDAQGNSVMVPTVRFLIRNGTETGTYKLRGGRNIKGTHKPWILEGYVRQMAAGATRFQQAPPFQFEFVVSESVSRARGANIGIWNDIAVTGSQILPWAQIFHSRGRKGFVRLDPRSPHVQGENGDISGWEPGEDHDNPAGI